MRRPTATSRGTETGKNVRAAIQVLVLLLVLAGLAACKAGILSGNTGDGSLLDLSLSDTLLAETDADADAGARPDCGEAGCDPDSRPPDGHYPDGHYPDGHYPDGHYPDGYLLDSQPPDGAPAPVCGNSSCETGESCSSCPGDCGACPPVCGNSACEAGESCSSCPGDCGACPPVCGNGSCETGETCSNCASDCGACPTTVTHETEFITWNLYNDAGCTSSNGVAKWYDRDNGPGSLSIMATLLTQNPAILALQEDGKLGPSSCSIGNVKDKVVSWLSSTHDVRSTDDVSGSWSGERYAILIKKSKYRFISAGYQKCYYNGSEVRGFMWAEVDLILDSTSNHFYVLNAHFKASTTSADIAQRAAQAQCVITWVNAKKVSNPNRAHFLLGDLNSGPDHNTQAYTTLTGSGGPFENTSTAGINAINTHGSYWIDHVLGTKNDFTKVGYGSWTVGAGQVTAGGTLSDHLGLRTRIGHLK